MRFCIAKRKIYTNGPKISFRGKFFYSPIGHSGHGVRDASKILVMTFPYGNLSEIKIKIVWPTEIPSKGKEKKVDNAGSRAAER